jgi:hypothetical protein
VRREYKYLVDETTAIEIRRRIAGICVPDEFTDARGRYTVDTLYLDTPDLRMYRATIENEGRRHKLRIRSYAGSKVVFLEVKRRVDDIIVKSRAKLGPEWVYVLEHGHGSGRDLETFLSHYHTSLFLPTVLVRYDREAYASTIDPYARLTFDRQIRYQPASQLSMQGDERAWVGIDDPISMRGPESYAVLELKFSDNAPGWMTNLVRSLELPRGAFSKYARAIDAMTLSPAARFAL